MDSKVASEFNFKIRTSRTAEREFDFERVNVFLGANGTGKTQLLQELKGQVGTLFPGYSPVNIEGGRAVQMYDSLELTPQNFSNFRTTEQILSGFRGNRGNTLTSRMFHGLKALEQMGIDAKIEHSDAVVIWQDLDDKSAPPKFPIDPMARVFETFNDIFPSISLEYKSNNRRLICLKKGNEYGPTRLSDGEKQVFSILVDIIELTDTKSVLFIDEPELNLNPGLANRLWSSIETLLPHAIFVYATHSVSFALRESVDRLIVLSNDDESIQELVGLDDLSQSEKGELLGNIPSLLAQKNTLVVEGHDASFDAIFYGWLLGEIDFSPAAVGGSEDVIAISSREGKWQKISPSVRLIGTIDADYKADDKISNLQNRNIVVLDYHEAESYMCDPQIIFDLVTVLGTNSEAINLQVIEDRIFSFLERHQLNICSRRANERLVYNIRPSVPSSALTKVQNYDDLERLFLSDVTAQMESANQTFDAENVREILRTEKNRIDNAIQNKNVSEALKLTPGKELLKTFPSLIGVSDSNSIARSVRKHLHIENYPALTSLQKTLMERINKI